MVKVIQDLWILEESGTVLFDRVFDEKIDKNLFGAMMSALNSFAAELAEGGLSSFSLSQKNFSLIKRKNCLFIASYPKKSREKKVIEELKKISKRFVNLYKEDLEHFEGEITNFKKFELEIEDSLEQVVNKLQKGFW